VSAAEEPRRTVECTDALPWLRAPRDFSGCSFVTSLPDVSELPHLSFDEWKQWFQDAAARVLSRCPPDGVALFFQSDIKTEGRWVDKGAWVSQAAEREGCVLLAHKIVCRRPAGTVTYGRAGYSHLLAFGRDVRVDLAKATPDVLPEAGETTWTRGMGLAACRAACDFVKAQTSSHTIVDPFCGRGAVLAVANAVGLHAIGVDLSAKRCRRARALRIELADC
jgi:hypothetical protein